ncbi:WD40 repeat domain-containing protein [Streptomyces sp. NPDC002920]
MAGHTDSVRSMAFSSDGKTLATVGDDHTLRLWNADKGTPLVTRKEHTDEVYAVAFSPDGHTLAAGSIDSTARLWNVASGKTLITLLGYSDAVFWLAFSPDGHTLATASADFTVRLWSTTLPRPEAALANICRTVGRDLTPQERTAYLPGQSNDPVCPSD